MTLAKLGIALAVILGALYGAFWFGQSNIQTKWDADIAERNLVAEKARSTKEKTNRIEEQRRQSAANSEAANAQPKINAARADGSALPDLARRMWEQAGNMPAGCSRTVDTGSAAPSTSASQAAMVLSDMLRRDQARLAELAPAYDESVARGVACQNTYNALKSGRKTP